MTYTASDTAKLIQLYEENPTLEMVNKLSVLFNKPKKSIIGKLSKEGVYQARGYRSKTGEIPITKLAIVRQIEDLLEDKFPGLDKAPKLTLVKLYKKLI